MEMEAFIDSLHNIKEFTPGLCIYNAQQKDLLTCSSANLWDSCVVIFFRESFFRMTTSLVYILFKGVM
jgi:hypothetical protein